jgi:hypothetical protein
MSDFALHLSRHVASALGRQFAFAEFLGERPWSVDIGSGTVTFGDDLTYPIQLLGTESHGDGTWLWAWANTQSNLPPDLLRAAEWLREYGSEHAISELTDKSFPLTTADGHKLSLLAAGLTGRGYYRGPYEGGALFFLVERLPGSVLAPVPPVRVIGVLTEALQSYELDHRVVVESFLTQQGFAVSSGPSTIAASHQNGSSLQVQLDELGRVRGFDANLKPG